MKKYKKYLYLNIIAVFIWLQVSLVLGLLTRTFLGEYEVFLIDHLRVFGGLFLIWIVIFFAFSMFEVATLRRFSLIFGNLFSAVLFAELFSVLYFYFQPELVFTPRRVLLLQGVFAYALLSFWFVFLKYIYNKKLLESVYLTRDGKVSDDIVEIIRRHEYLGFRFKGYIDEYSFDVSSDSLLVLSDKIKIDEDVFGKLFKLKKKGVRFTDSVTFYEELQRKVLLDKLDVSWFLENVDYQKRAVYEVSKRVVDIVFGVFAFLVFIITLPLLYFFIRFSTGGSAFFLQPRVGRYGKIFNVYKYRTMRAGTAGDQWTSDNDVRITKFGSLLRKIRLDELPQAINLIIGNMSLVGPRPEQVNIVNSLKEDVAFYDERHLVKPGLTGWAQINNTYSASVEETRNKLQYDLYYIKYRSLIFDLEIILKTIYYVIIPHGK